MSVRNKSRLGVNNTVRDESYVTLIVSFTRLTVFSVCIFVDLHHKLEASPYLAVDNILSAQIDVFQAYIGAIVTDYSLDEAQRFVSSLVAFEIGAPSELSTGPGVPSSSTPLSIPALDSKAEQEDMKNQPSPPLYARSALTPLGAPPDLDISPDSSTSSEPRREQSRTTSL